MAVGTSNHHRQRHASSVMQLNVCGSLLAAIGGMGAGCGATERGCGRHPIQTLVAIPRQSLPIRPLPAIPRARCAHTRLAPPSVESDRRRWWRLPLPVAAHVIGCQYAGQTEWPNKLLEVASVAV
jgi:hypothetical protein